MKKYFLSILVLLLLLQKNASTQYLVPNGSFESYSTCPTIPNQINRAIGWFQPHKYPGNFSVNQSSSSDYLNSCSTSGLIDVPNNFAGYQYALSGNAYIGLALFNNYMNGNAFREYAEVKLSQQLVANKKYNFKCSVSMANGSNWSITKFDAYFSNDSLLYTDNDLYKINAIPQIQNNIRINDTLNWVELSGSFIAEGGENFLTIGNFQDGSVCDTLLNSNTVTVAGAYYYFDDVSLELDTITAIEELSNNNFQVYPNPSKSSISINSAQQLKEIKILDLSGKLLFQQKAKSSTETLNVSFLENGIYLLQCSFSNGAVGYNKFVKQRD